MNFGRKKCNIFIKLCTPGPNQYKGTIRLDENEPKTIATRHISISAHKCDHNCFSEGHCQRSRACHDAYLKKSANSKRQSLEPRNANCRKKNDIETSKMDNKDQARVLKRQSLNFQSPENKENWPTPLKKKVVSSIPRFTKTTTEGQSPSFMTRPRNIHDCLTNEDSESPSYLTSHFNRNSLKRKSIKVKKSEENTTQLVKRPFNVSYTVLPKLEEKSPAKLNQSANVECTSTEKILKDMSNIIEDMGEITWKGQVLKNSVPTHKNFDEDKSPRVFTKNLKLKHELAVDDCETSIPSDTTIIENTFNKEKASDHKSKKEIRVKAEIKVKEEIDIVNEDHTNISANKNDAKLSSEENEDGLRSHDIFAIQDCNLILLVNEEFIDDEYDSYIQGFNTSKGHLQVLQNNELYQMTSSLVRVFLENNTVPEKSVELPGKGNSSKIQKVTGSKIGKYPNKQKKNKKAKKANNLDEIGKIVKAAIQDLKGEFQKEIFTKTNEKLDLLVAELKNVVLKANDDIESTCEKATTNLISRLENIALNY